MTDSSDELTARERLALAALPRETPPPPRLEEATVAALRTRGLLGRPSRWRRLPAIAAGLAAAALLVVAGFVAGRRAAPGAGPAVPQYLLLLYEGPGYRQPPAGEESQRVREYAAWAGERAATRELVAGEKLREGTDRVVRADGDSAPPVAGAERLAGFFVIRAATPGRALEIARSSPHVRYGGSIVVREIEPT